MCSFPALLSLWEYQASRKSLSWKLRALSTIVANCYLFVVIYRTNGCYVNFFTTSCWRAQHWWAISQWKEQQQCIKWLSHILVSIHSEVLIELWKNKYSICEFLISRLVINNFPFFDSKKLWTLKDCIMEWLQHSFAGLLKSLQGCWKPWGNSAIWTVSASSTFTKRLWLQDA